MSKKTIRLTESDLKQYISKVISEQGYIPGDKPNGNMTTIDRFGSFDAKTLKERGFIVKGGVATLNHPHPKLVVTVKPSQKGWAAYQGGVLKFDLPHDDCDVQLDKLIGYNSLHGGYKTGLKETQLKQYIGNVISENKVIINENIGNDIEEYRMTSRRISQQLEAFEEMVKKGDIRRANEEKGTIYKFIGRLENVLMSLKRRLM
jgi:hypothetical protein